MEFSFRVSEAEYRQAWKLRVKAKKGTWPSSLKSILFWVFILICLMLLWAVVSRSANQPNEPQHAVVVAHQQSRQPGSATSPTETLLFNVGPFVLLICLWVYFAFFRLRRQLRRTYLSDPVMQGTFTVSIDPASITIRNTAGTLFQAGWNVYEGWYEGKGIALLVRKGGACNILSLAGLSDFQRNELRSILSAALPKK